MLRAFGPPGFRVARSFAALIPTPHSTHIFASPGNLRFPLSGLQKRHIQPERYVQLVLNLLENYKIKNQEISLFIYSIILFICQ
jgi:hypothetical protein